MASFKEAFAAARKKLGAGKTFEWNGKSYSTNYKEEVSKPASAAPTKSIRPKAKPAAAPKPTTGLTNSQRLSAWAAGRTDLDSAGAGERKKSRLITTNTKPKSSTTKSESSTTRLDRLKKESAMQKDRSAVKLGMTLRERNQK
jgi:hypothetical protein